METGTVSERHVQAVWYDAALRPSGLRTARGAAVRVVDPGSWNLEAGPDFRHAVLEVGPARRRLVGDVEVHLRPDDWVRHRHASDPAYREVVAHVTWYCGPPPAGDGGLPDGCVSVCIGDEFRRRGDFCCYEIDLGAYPYAKLPREPRPCELALAGRTDDALALVRAYGARRMELKARRMRDLFVRLGSVERVFYEEAFAALGFKYNAFPFRSLASAVPWPDLPRDPEAAYVCLKCAAEMSAPGAGPWRCANVRPANSPGRRLRAAAKVFARGPGMWDELAACGLADRRGQREALRVFRGLPVDGFPELGDRRAAAVLANVLVPLALADGRLGAVPSSLLPEDVSAPVRLTAFRMLGRDHNPGLYAGDGLLIQGLIQIHRDHCLAAHPDCAGCTLLDGG